MRLIGAALIIASTSLMGASGVMRLRARVRALSSLTTGLGLMKSEVCSRLSPMSDALEELARSAPEPARSFFANVSKGMERLGAEPMSEIWSSALSDTPKLLLTWEEERAVAELGLSLGRYDASEQAAAIERAKLRVEGYLRAAEEERRRDSRLHAFFGIAGGLFAVIILM